MLANRKYAAIWLGGTLMTACVAQDERDDVSSEITAVAQPLAALATCNQETDCASGLACVAGTCGTCSAHSQCQSDVCDAYAATSLGPGACVRPTDVVYVDCQATPACETGDGSRSSPVCTIAAGIARAIGNRFAVRVYPGQYFPFGVARRTVSIFGPGDGSAVVGEEDNTTGVRISQQARVVLDGLDVGQAVLTGVNVADSNVQLRNATISATSRGIVSTNSTLVVDRVRATGSVTTGLLVDGGSYNISNSYFGGGDRPAVIFTGASSGRFRFNSVLGGGEISRGGIDCGTSPRLIQDSIVVRNFAADGGAQTVGACSHERVVVGSGDGRGDPGLIKIDPELDAQGRLLDTAANAACCIDRGARFVSSLYRDFFGTPRPQGASNDIGAHEHRPGLSAAAPSPP